MNNTNERADGHPGRFPESCHNFASFSTIDDFMICMSVVEEGPHIGFAAYNEKSNQIILEQCIADGYETQNLAETVLSSIRPNLLLLSNKIVSNDALLEVLTTSPLNFVDEISCDDGDAEGKKNCDNRKTDSTRKRSAISLNNTRSQYRSRTIPYRLLKTSSFDTRACRELILRLNVASLMHRPCQSAAHSDMLRSTPLSTFSNESPHFKVSSYHSLASLIDFDSKVQIQSLGSLLSFLQTTIYRLEDGGLIHVNDIVQAKASTYMRISTETLSSLHIFATEHHPIAAAKGYGNSKEGFSLFSLLDRTKSKAGRQKLREWMLKPLCDVYEIALRQDGVELFMLPAMQRPVGSILNLLERIGPVDQILVRIQKCCSKPNDFLLLAKALSSAVAITTMLHDEILPRLQQHILPDWPRKRESIVDSLPQQEKYTEFIARILDHCHSNVLRNLFDRVTSIVDEEATFECKALVIRRGHHEQLDIYKQQFACLEETLQSVGAHLAQRIPHLRNFMEVIFIPQIGQVGFLVALDNQVKWSGDRNIPEDFIFVFTEGEKSFFKNMDVRNLDERIGDLDAYIKDTEAIIVAELEEEVLDLENEIRETFTILAELDCLLSLADCAFELKYVRPTVVPAIENCIRITKGRHPLQEIILENDFKSNDTFLNTSRRVNIITGPNFSGKSCYARQVGMLVYMAHIGCFIPCENARISITDQILARFSTSETCSVPQSSFQLDLTQMGQIMRRSTPNSLLIIDEFGKGTTPASGIALLTAILRRLTKSQSKVICTTHFLDIFSMGLLADNFDGIKALHMAVHISTTSDEGSKPTFGLEDGVANSSAGLVCARKAGVKEAVLERAYDLVQALQARRKVQPLVEIIRCNLDFSAASQKILEGFLSMEWSNASDEEVDHFLTKIHEL